MGLRLSSQQNEAVLTHSPSLQKMCLTAWLQHLWLRRLFKRDGLGFRGVWADGTFVYTNEEEVWKTQRPLWAITIRSTSQRQDRDPCGCPRASSFLIQMFTRGQRNAAEPQCPHCSQCVFLSKWVQWEKSAPEEGRYGFQFLWLSLGLSFLTSHLGQTTNLNACRGQSQKPDVCRRNVMKQDSLLPKVLRVVP